MSTICQYCGIECSNGLGHKCSECNKIAECIRDIDFKLLKKIFETERPKEALILGIQTTPLRKAINWFKNRGDWDFRFRTDCKHDRIYYVKKYGIPGKSVDAEELIRIAKDNGCKF